MARDKVSKRQDPKDDCNYLSKLLSVITSVLSERPVKLADQKTERGKILNPDYNIFRDQPTAGASPLRVNTLLCSVSRNSMRNHHCNLPLFDRFSLGDRV